MFVSLYFSLRSLPVLLGLDVPLVTAVRNRCSVLCLYTYPHLHTLKARPWSVSTAAVSRYPFADVTGVVNGDTEGHGERMLVCYVMWSTGPFLGPFLAQSPPVS